MDQVFSSYARDLAFVYHGDGVNHERWATANDATWTAPEDTSLVACVRYGAGGLVTQEWHAPYLTLCDPVAAAQGRNTPEAEERSNTERTRTARGRVLYTLVSCEGESPQRDGERPGPSPTLLVRDSSREETSCLQDLEGPEGWRRQDASPAPQLRG